VATAGGARRIVAHVYDSADPVATIASFARDVADAARAGDAVAVGILREAAGELAATALAAARNAGVADGPFSYAGGLFAAGDLLLDPLREALPDLRPPRGDALDGAARLLDRPPLFSDLIHETGDP
jgi:N-acetylglucosamine kinase-like BadF-type ATPase